MIDSKFTILEGQEFFIIQSKDSKANLGISKTYFHQEAEKYAWKKESGDKNAVYYYIPREYAEKRWVQLRATEALQSSFNTLEETSGVNVSKQVYSTEPFNNDGQPKHSTKTSDRTVDHFASLLDDTISRLVDEKDARIRQLEEALDREKHFSNELQKSKENEIQTLKTSLLLFTSKPQSRDYEPKMIEYTPKPENKGFWDNLKSVFTKT
jgi:hypothetical protein